MNHKLRSAVIAAAGALTLGFGVNAMADTTDDLLNALIAKGVLTEEEGALLLKGRSIENDNKKTAIVPKFKDGISLESADGKHSISINGRVQADYHAYGKSDAQNTNSFDVRRAYLTVKGKIYNDYDFNVSADFGQGQSGASTGTSQMDVAYFGINWWPQAKFRFGQFDMPFGLEHLTSDLFTDFTERSFTDALVPGKERGAMIHGAPFKGVYYGLAASNGRGKSVNNADNQVDGVDIIGRATVNLAEVMEQAGVVYHVGGDFSHGYISPNQATNSGTLATNSFLVGQGAAASQTEGRGITFFTPTGLSAPAGEDVKRTRLGLEGAVAIGPVKLQSEWMKHNYSGNNNAIAAGAGLPAVAAGSYDKDVTAWYVSANWLVTGESYADTYKDGVWGRIKPKNNFEHGDAGFKGAGAWVIGLRYSDYDASDFSSGVGRVGLVNGAGTSKTPDGAHAWTAGVTWIINPNLRFAANYIDTKLIDGVAGIKNNQGAVIGTTDGEQALTLRGTFDF